MSSDLKLEVFAFQFFQAYWHRVGFLSQSHSVSFMYPDEYNLDPQNTEIYEESHMKAVFVKEFFYHYVLDDELCKIIPEFQCSPSYILDCISRTFKRDGVFADLNVFELLFTSCAFVVNLVLFIVEYFGYRDVVSYAHLCWAAYFDEYKEDFYRQGGWNRLMILSCSYTMVFELVFSFPHRKFNEEKERRNYIRHTMESVNNYKSFTSCFDADSETVSKGWAKFYLQNNNKFHASSSEADVTKDEGMTDPKVIEKLLLQFRRLCDPGISEVPHVFSCTTTRSQHTDSGKQYNEEIFRSILKLTNLSLNDLDPNSTSDTQIKLIKNGLDLRESAFQTDNLFPLDLSEIERRNDQINKLLVIDLSGVEGNDDGTLSDKRIKMDLSRSKETIFNIDENEESQNASFLKLQFSNDSSQNKTLSPSKKKLMEDLIKQEIDLERRNPEVQCLLKMILVLGDVDDVAHFRSALTISDTHKRMKKCKTKSKRK